MLDDREIILKALQKADYVGVARDYAMLQHLRLRKEDTYEIIFSHKFAKAFWGEKILDIEWGIEMATGHTDIGTIYAWQYHLQQMAIEENPLKYIEKFL